MKESVRTVLLAAAALLMTFAAAGYALHVVPDLHGDLVELNVRPTVLGGTVLYLRFAAIAMFAFSLMVGWAAVQSARGRAPALMPLAVVAALYAVFGVMAFSRSHSPHHLGFVLMAVLLAAALAVPRTERSTA